MTMLFSQVEEKIMVAARQPSVIKGLTEALADPEVLQRPENQAILNAMRDAGTNVSITSDSSFLIGADERLTAAFRIGFVEASLSVFLVAAIIVALGFLVSWFIKEIPLRSKSAAQENAESHMSSMAG
jgi:hypothetical protein